MTTTYSYSPFTADKDKVRFYCGDVDIADSGARAFFTDEEITALITLEGTWQKAVIACIKNMINRLATQPTLRADWLQTDYATAIKGLNDLLKLRAAEFGLSAGRAITGSVTHTYRPDSNQTETIDYDDE
jgi:hypothetical protein